MTLCLPFESSLNADKCLGMGCLQPMLISAKRSILVNRDALWRILGLRGVPPKLIDPISELYSGTESAVRCGGSIFNLIPVVIGVCQGCVLAPTLFNACMDWILGRCLRDEAVVHRLGMSRSLTLISQMMQSFLQRHWISL